MGIEKCVWREFWTLGDPKLFRGTTYAAYAAYGTLVFQPELGDGRTFATESSIWGAGSSRTTFELEEALIFRSGELIIGQHAVEQHTPSLLAVIYTVCIIA